MSCQRELKKLEEGAEKAPPSEYRTGFLTAVREAIEIVEEHEEDESE